MKKVRKNYNWIIYTSIVVAYFFITYILYLTEKDVNGSSIKSFSDTIWFSIITLTSVGYGDKVPASGMGQIISLIFVIGSLGLIGVIVSRVSNKIAKMIEERKLGYNGTRFENHIVIIHYNQFTQQVLTEITNAGKKAVVVTSKKEDIDLIYHNFDKNLVFVLYHDYIDIHAFDKANIGKSISVLLNFEDDTQNLVQLISLREKYDNLNFVISLNNPSLKETFRSLGVTFTLSKNEVASKLIASYVFEPEVAKLTENLMRSSTADDDLGILQYKVVMDNHYLNQNYIDTFISLKKENNIILVGISKLVDGQYHLIKNPKDDIQIELNDYLIVIGNDLAKKQIFEKFKIEEGK